MVFLHLMHGAGGVRVFMVIPIHSLGSFSDRISWMYHQPSSIDFPKVRLFCGIPKLHPQLSLLTFLRFFCFVRCYSTIRCTFSALLASSCGRRCVATAAATQLHSLRCDIHHASCCVHVFVGLGRSWSHRGAGGRLCFALLLVPALTSLICSGTVSLC